MKLVLIRHGIAEDRGKATVQGMADEERPLTEDGRKKLRIEAMGLWRLVPDITIFVASPARRAVETAEALAHPFGNCSIVTNQDLAPGGDWRRLPDWLRQNPMDHDIALVGHEPELGKLACWLLAGNETAFILFKKGGTCLIEFSRDISPGMGVLHWVLTPAQLRRLGR